MHGSPLSQTSKNFWSGFWSGTGTGTGTGTDTVTNLPSCLQFFPGLWLRITSMRIRVLLFTLSGSGVSFSLQCGSGSRSCSSSKWWESATTGTGLYTLDSWGRAIFWASRPPLWASTALQCSVLSLWSIWVLVLMRTRIQLFTSMRIRIQLPKIMRTRIRNHEFFSNGSLYRNCYRFPARVCVYRYLSGNIRTIFVKSTTTISKCFFKVIVSSQISFFSTFEWKYIRTPVRTLKEELYRVPDMKYPNFACTWRLKIVQIVPYGLCHFQCQTVDFSSFLSCTILYRYSVFCPQNYSEMKQSERLSV